MTSRSTSIPAPLGGWNARDSVADMDEQDAVVLTNWYPGTTDVLARKGFTQYATGFSTDVNSFLPYSGGGSISLFAASSTHIYDVSSTGAIGAAVVSGLTSSKFISINISTTGGNFLMAVNNSDKLQGYNGTSWWVDGDGTHDITGFDTSTASFIFLTMHRVFMIEHNTLNFWYLGTESIAGSASKFSLQAVARQGGYLVAMGSWTLDAGFGSEDLTVFVTNHGEIIVYGGTDPASSSTWALRGVWKIGSPIGSNCLFKYAGDMLYISRDGLVPLSTVMQSDRLNPKTFLSNKIQWAISNAVTSYGSNYGWQAIYYPNANMILLNVPVGSGIQEQYVMNTITQSWARFTGYNANCWVLYNENIYFGANGYVGQAWNGYIDNTSAIQSYATQAYSYFKSKGQKKRFTMARPIMLASGSPSIKMAVNTDFNTSQNYAPLSFTPTTQAVWDTAVWDTDVWSDTTSVVDQWQGINGLGFAAGISLQSQSSGIEVHWVSTDLVYEIGGVL
jgi:hypothetical protein